MNRIAIFVEGLGDVKFIKDFISEHFNNENDNIQIIDVKGKDKLANFAVLMKEVSDDNGENIVIFDCDDQRKEGGLELRNKTFQEIRDQYDVEFSTYLFPNNQSEGDLETLLENIINSENIEIFNCWEAYENCISNKINPHSEDNSYTIPAKKSKIYSYLECLLPNTKKGKDLAKDPNRDYRNREHWNIHSLENPYVKNLVDFLSPFFENNEA